MTWQEFGEKLMALRDDTTREEWQAALDHARSLLPLVDEADRALAKEIIGDTLIQSGVFLGYVDDDEEPVTGPREPEHEPPGEGIANDLIGDDPEPDDGWIEVDDEGYRLPRKPPGPARQELIRTCRALDRDDVTQAEWDADWERMVRLAAEVEAGGSHLELECLAMMNPAMGIPSSRK